MSQLIRWRRSPEISETQCPTCILLKTEGLFISGPGSLADDDFAVAFHRHAIVFSSAGLYWKVSMWLTPPLINSEITDLGGAEVSGLASAAIRSWHRCGDALSGQQLILAEQVQQGQAADSHAASIQNLRREMYCCLRSRSFNDMMISPCQHRYLCRYLM